MTSRGLTWPHMISHDHHMTSHDLITSFIGTGLPEPINSCAFSTLYDPLFCEGVMMCMERKEGSRTKEGGGRERGREGGREGGN